MDCIDVLIKKLRGDGANAQKDKINEGEDDEMVMYKVSTYIQSFRLGSIAFCHWLASEQPHQTYF